MKTKFQQGLAILFVGISVILTTTHASAQTDGTLTFTFTETAAGQTKNVLAVWIQDNNGVFVKTKMRFWGTKTTDHLPTWKANSSQNVVDATTGATLTASTSPTAYGVKTVTWDGKNASSVTVADGTYKILVESSWGSPEPSSNNHSTLVTYTFTKGATATHATPTADATFSNITIDWVPAATVVEELSTTKSITVYPNPSKGSVQLDFQRSYSVTRILVENMAGEVVYQEAPKQNLLGVKSMDLQWLPNGVYVVEVLSDKKSDSYKSKIIITK